jgi:pimeloyl-ACP methyl ester carboxylesterase
MLREQVSRAVMAALLAGLAGLAQNPACAKGTLGGPLVLADQGSFFVGGRTLTSQTPGAPAQGFLSPGDITVDQMYVQYMVPEKIKGPPVIMVHGFNHTGVTYETTPDGREGWATYFVRKGYPVYVVDQAGRGRSGFDPTVFNHAKLTGDVSGIPNVPLYPMKFAWINFRFGKEYPVPFPGVQFPLDALNEYSKELVPNLEGTLAGDVQKTSDGLVALLDRIGPAVVVGHSQAGGIVLAAVKSRPEKTLAFVDVEGNCTPISAEDISRVFSKVALLSVFGDNSNGAQGANGDTRRNGCVSSTNAIREQKGPAEMIMLADNGMPGHSHMMMMDKGNLAIADLIMDWLKKQGIRSQKMPVRP